MLNYMVRATVLDVFMFLPTALVALTSVLIAVFARSSTNSPFRKRELLLATPMIFVVLLIVHGTVFTFEDSISESTTWKTRVIGAILVTHFVSCVTITWVMKGMRIYTVSTLTFLTCFVLMASLEAHMSVTNSWL